MTPRDEILEAKLPGGGGRVKEERKRERLSKRAVESLARPTTPYNRKGSHRAVPSTNRMARQFSISDWLIDNRQSSIYPHLWIGRLRSAVGEQKKWSAGVVTAGTKPERNAAAEPQTEARRSCGTLRMLARDECAV